MVYISAYKHWIEGLWVRQDEDSGREVVLFRFTDMPYQAQLVAMQELRMTRLELMLSIAQCMIKVETHEVAFLPEEAEFI